MDLSGWRLVLRRLRTRIWSRLAAFAIGAVAVALLAGLAGRVVTASPGIDIGQDSVRGLLQILATSMLAVTTFSLTAMISAYASAAARTTPRATQLLVEDRTSQNALSSFLGAFVFAVVGLAALSTEYYGDEGRIVLYVGTLVVIAIVVVTLLRWIQHLVDFGRMSDVLDRVERAALETIEANARRPHLGGSPPVAIPAHAVPAASQQGGTVVAVHLPAIEDVAARGDLTVHVVAVPGSAVGVGEPLARVVGPVDDDALAAIRRAFVVERHRTFEQDPRLGPVALAEIGSRALSPAVNDPGSAIEALNAIQRVLTVHVTTAADGEVAHPRVHVPSVSIEDLVEDALRPIARDGAAMVEVGIRVQRVIGALIRVAGPDDAERLREASRRAERRCADALTHPHDATLVADAARAAREIGAAT